MNSKISRMQVLNKEYKPLRLHTHQVLKALTELGFEHEWGYFAQHSVRNGSEWFFEHYPIPVITIRDICEIGFDLSQTFLECKVSREEALEFDFKRLQGFNFEVYGIKEYLNDFYNAKQDIEDIHGKIDKSDEQEIGISLLFGYMESVETIINAVGSLQQIITEGNVQRKAAQQKNATDDGDSAG
jgi:hypothetical protein